MSVVEKDDIFMESVETHLQGFNLNLGDLWDLQFAQSKALGIQISAHSALHEQPKKSTLTISFHSHYFMIEGPLKHADYINTWEFRECSKWSLAVWKCVCVDIYVCLMHRVCMHCIFQLFHDRGMQKHDSLGVETICLTCNQLVQCQGVYTEAACLGENKRARLHKSVSCSVPQSLCCHSTVRCLSLM